MATNLIIMESPWAEAGDTLSFASVRPFCEALRSSNTGGGDSYNIYYYQFNDGGSFLRAMDYWPCRTGDDSLLYIASHGLQGKIAGMNGGTLVNYLSNYRERTPANTYIRGCVVGSCFFAGARDNALRLIAAGNLHWLFGYGCGVEWLAATITEISVINAFINDLSNAPTKYEIKEKFSKALEPFNPCHQIGTNPKNKPASAKDSWSMWARGHASVDQAEDCKQEVLALIDDNTGLQTPCC